MRGKAWHAALQWELSVRSWDESATYRRKRRGEKTHIHLDRTKAYKCARITPRGIAPFACFQKQEEAFELQRLYGAPSHLLVPAATKNRRLVWVKTAGNRGVSGIYRHSEIFQERSWHQNKPWCVSMLCMSASQIDSLAHFGLYFRPPTPHLHHIQSWPITLKDFPQTL